jgi:hypothetical protein
MDPKLLDQARAMITWGEDPDSVRRLLLSKDVSDREAEECVALLCTERNREIRWNGARKILIGIVCLGISIAGFYFLWTWIATRHGRRTSWILTLLLSFGGYGLWNLVDGLIYLIRPQLETRAISELSD